jgi:hypothetical protein
MAQPRVFISSTCYDLQEIRFQLRSFVEDFGFIPVMSEFGDIFYDYQKHTQDACKDEIEKSQLFLLIIGNNYGSIYYKQKEIAKNPDSVTLQEYKKAIEVDIYKHIFINKFVDYDYKNYQKALNKFISNNIEKQELDESKIDDTILTLKNEFKSKYPFPQDSYKFIFNFLDVIYSLKTNNAIITYESFEDIKESLRKQWAGFMYDAITKSKTVSVNLVEKIGEKIERVENQIKLLAEGQINHENGNPKLTLDISRLTNELNLEEFSKIKEEIHSKIYELLLVGSSSYETHPRIKIRTNVTVENINQWFSSLETIVKKYKWAKTISTTVVFSELGVQYSYYKNFQDIPFELILSFYSLYLNAKNSLVEEDFNGLLTLVCDKFNEYYEPEPKKSGDDLPF